MRPILITISAFLLTGCANLNNFVPRDDWWIGDWSTSSKVAFGIAATCHTIDSLQTEAWLDKEPWIDDRNVQHTPQEGFATWGFWGGKHPDESDLVARAVTWTGLTYYGATLVTEERHDRMWMIALMTAPCVMQVTKNHQMGIRINFGGDN